MWKEILWSKDLFHKGVGKIVRNGRGTFFWIDKWLDGFRLNDEAILERTDHLISYRVSD